MKRLIYYIVIIIGAYWGYNHFFGSDDAEKSSTYVKQVRVAVQTANLRTGPGTNYGYATTKADGSGGKWQVRQGTLLNVLSAKQGWYEVHVGKDTRSVYIKQSLCTDVKGGGKAKKASTKATSSKAVGKKATGADASGSTAPKPQTPASNNASDEDVVEEVQSEAADDVIF